MKNFLQSEILLILLTVANIIYAPYPYLCIFTASLLMILFCIRSLSEKENILSIGLQFLISGAFYICGNFFLSALIFREIHITKKKWEALAFPPTVFVTIEMIKQKMIPANIIFFMLILLLISAFLLVLEQLIENYINAKNQIAKAISVTAVNELYEKKLNKELIIKNYLSDRTARLEERENISRNIHNSVGHSITTAVMVLETADMLFETKPDVAREKMLVARERIKDSLQSIRHAVRILDEDNLYISLDDLKSECISVIDNFTMDTMIRVRTDFQEDISEFALPHEQSEFLTDYLGFSFRTVEDFKTFCRITGVSCDFDNLRAGSVVMTSLLANNRGMKLGDILEGKENESIYGTYTLDAITNEPGYQTYYIDTGVNGTNRSYFLLADGMSEQEFADYIEVLMDQYDISIQSKRKLEERIHQQLNSLNVLYVFLIMMLAVIIPLILSRSRQLLKADVCEY